MGLWGSASEQFDGWSRRYDASLLQQIFFGPSHRALESLLPPLVGLTVLDVGCGTGRLLCRLAERHPSARLFGLDLSNKMLECAQQNAAARGASIHFVQGECERLPFKNGQFDVIICSHGFHHFTDQPRAVAEMARVLGPGGMLFLIDGDRDSWWGWFVFHGIVTLIEGPVHHCSAYELSRFCRWAGLAVGRMHRQGGIAPFLILQATRSAARATAPHLEISSDCIRAA